MVFSPAESRRYVGVRGWPGTAHKENLSQLNPLAIRSELEPNQRPGGWRYHPERRSRTGTDEMRNHRAR